MNLFVLLMLGCGSDPILERADEATKTAPKTNNVAPNPGIPEEPKPGIPSQPPPGEGPMPGGQPVFDGPTVTVTGEIKFPSYKQGKVRIDVFDGDQRDHSIKPSVVTTKELEQPGEFTLSVPESVKHVWISAFVDQNNNQRPDHGDPTGFYVDNPVSTKKNVNGLIIELKEDAPKK